MGTSRNQKNNRPSNHVSRLLMGLILAALAVFWAGCGEDGPAAVIDETIPDSAYWTINSTLVLDPDVREDITADTEETESEEEEESEEETVTYEDYIEPQLAVAEEDGRIHMAYYDINPDTATRDETPYRLMYKSFMKENFLSLNEGNTLLEQVTLIGDDFRDRSGLDISVAGGKVIISYPEFHEMIDVEEGDLNNQGDVLIAVRDGESNWRQEIGAYGYVSPERNPVFRDGLAMSDFCLLGTEAGQVMLSFQFYYEGIDSYNFTFPDMRYIAQPVDAFDNADVNDVAELEETVEGNYYQNNASGQQVYQGGSNKLILDIDGNPLAFYYRDNRMNGYEYDYGLRYSRRVEGEWQTPEWIEERVEVTAIAPAVRSGGGIFVAYTVEDLPDFISSNDTLYSVVKFAEQIDVVTGVDEEGNEIHEWEWETGFVNYNTISGAYLTVAMDEDDLPVVAYYDEMNMAMNRFFSRLKMSRRTAAGDWEVYVITPEDVGLSNNTSYYDALPPGSSDKYYIGKYNHLWFDQQGRINLISYSTVNKKVFLFQMDD